MSNMKNLLVFVVAIAFGTYVVHATPVAHQQQQQQLVAAQCASGPSFWCENLRNAKMCNAVRHCIQTVWEKHDVPINYGNFCEICKDTVAIAHNVLRSNETKHILKVVLELPCILIPFECMRYKCNEVVDNFAVEFLEALSSIMKPDKVCSVLGLCNNAKIDKLNEEVSTEVQAKIEDLGTFIAAKFDATNRDDMLENVLHLCGEMSTFSDACSNIVLTYFNDIYDYLKKNLNAGGMCHLFGGCASNYQRHSENEKDTVVKEDFTAFSNVEGDDIVCKSCKKLVQHSRDLLAANTTEAEFKQVFEDLCKKTKDFKEDCLFIIDQFFDMFYQILLHKLDANGACILIGVCPKTQGMFMNYGQEIRTLLPAAQPADVHVTIRKKLGANEPKYTKEELKMMTLPIDRLMGAANSDLLVDIGPLCILCEYILHFIQEALATPSTEDEIKHTVNSICDKVPNGVKGQCHNFVNMYGDEVIALLIQGPRDICPKLQMCPNNLNNREDMEVISPITVHSDENDKPTCPLCLFAVQQAQQLIKDNKSKDDLKMACNKLKRKNMEIKCNNFVDLYGDKIATLILKEMEPKMVCRELGLCLWSELEDLDMNEALKYDVIAAPQQNMTLVPYNRLTGLDDVVVKKSRTCVLCKFVMTKLKAHLKNKTTKDGIKHAIKNVCHHMPKIFAHICEKFVEKHATTIIALIGTVPPKEICRRMHLCMAELNAVVNDEVIECGVCHGVSKGLLPYFKKQENNENIVTQDLIAIACETLPAKYYTICSEMVTIYGQSISHLSQKSDINESMVCAEIGKCFDNEKSGLAFARITA